MKTRARHNDRIFLFSTRSSRLFFLLFFFFLFFFFFIFCFLPISPVSSTCPTEKMEGVTSTPDRLLPRTAIYRYSINHFSSYREVSACDKSVNRWTAAKRNGTGETIRFPSMKFLRTKANTLFFSAGAAQFQFRISKSKGAHS